MKPWDLKGSDEALAPYWDKVHPEEFYFAISREDDITTVCITPAEFFNKYEKIYTDSMPINKYLPTISR